MFSDKKQNESYNNIYIDINIYYTVPLYIIVSCSIFWPYLFFFFLQQNLLNSIILSSF